MSRRHWLRLAGLGAAVAAFSLVAVTSIPQSPERHRDGEGPLASTNQNAITNSLAIDPLVGGAVGITTWSVGMRLCLTDGETRAVLESVEPTATVGAGFRFLGALVRRFTLTPENDGIGSVAGFPPPLSFVPDPLRDVTGFAVTTQCGPDGLGAAYTELILGFAVTGPDGGGWEGVDVAYASGGRRHVLAITNEYLICGSAVPDKCMGPGGTPPP